MSETAALDIDHLRTWIGKVEETTERPPRTQGEIVTDEDGSGATALAEFLASKKFI